MKTSMSIQETLAHYESLIPYMKDTEWDQREWPHEDARAGMRLHRLWKKIGDDQVMLHRFIPESGTQSPHHHPKAVAAHVLGPGEYEVGFIVDGVCQTRMISSQEFYYEMITPEVRHYVLPRSGPVYSVAIWTEFPRPSCVPDIALQLRPGPQLLEVVSGAFERIWRD